MNFKATGVKAFDVTDPGNAITGILPTFFDRTPNRADQAHASDNYTSSFHARIPYDVQKAILVADAVRSVNCTVYRFQVRKATVGNNTKSRRRLLRCDIIFCA